MDPARRVKRAASSIRGLPERGRWRGAACGRGAAAV